MANVVIRFSLDEKLDSDLIGLIHSKANGSNKLGLVVKKILQNYLAQSEILEALTTSDQQVTNLSPTCDTLASDSNDLDQRDESTGGLLSGLNDNGFDGFSLE